MKKKHFLTGLITIIVAIVLCVSIKVAIDFNKETKIKNEVKEIISAFNTNNFEGIDEILDRRLINGGSYAEVESSLKQYYSNLYSSLENINFLFDNDNFSNYLSNKNLKEDRPSFIKSKNNLQNSKAQIEENYNKFLDTLSNDSTKITYLANKDLKKYYRDFYLEIANSTINEEIIKNIESKYQETLDKIAIYNETFDFLAANKGHWEVQNEAIVFDDTIIYEEYVNITNKLNITSAEKNDKEEVSTN